MKKRIIVYIDGFNLYYAIKALNRPHLKWVNLWTLSEGLLRKDQKLVAVKYFSAVPTSNNEKQKRHMLYSRALNTVGVEVINGQFKYRDKKCPKCGREFKVPEEKETDVNIAVQLLKGAFLDEYDVAFVITGDSDLSNAIEETQKSTKKKVIVIAPPGRYSFARNLFVTLSLTKGRLEKALLDENIKDQKGNVIKRPNSYSPNRTYLPKNLLREIGY